MLELKINGLQALDQALSELPLKVERNIVRGMLRAAAAVIVGQAKQRVPVRSGRLAKSIRARSGLRNGRPQAQVRVGGTGKGAAWYAHLVEFGAAPHDIKPRSRKSLFLAGLAREIVHHPGATAHPFMRPAMDASHLAAAEAAAAYARKRLTKEGINLPEPEPDDLEAD